MSAISFERASFEHIPWIMALEKTARDAGFLRGDDAAAHRAKMADPGNAYRLIMADGARSGFLILCGLGTVDRSVELQRIIIETPGKGFGRAAIMALLDQLFTQDEANRVWLDVVDHNDRAQHLYRSIGFVQEGLMRQSLQLNGRFLDQLLFSLLAAEWQAQSVRST